MVEIKEFWLLASDVNTCTFTIYKLSNLTNFGKYLCLLNLCIYFSTHAGAKVTVNGSSMKIVRAILLSGVFDAPAKCAVQNFSQYSGFFGCPYCLEKGETCWISAHGHRIIYPFNMDSETGHSAERTHELTLQFGKDAQAETIHSGKPAAVFGVKSLSWIMYFPRFNCIRGMAIDYMHSVLLGTVKMLTTLWFDKAYKKFSWYVGDKGATIGQQIKCVRMPNCISRLNRSTVEDLHLWKASEYRTFLLFYSVPVLWRTLPDEYFQHYLLLVQAIYLMLQESISPSDISTATKLLKQFCLQIRSLYGSRYQTFNVHNLIHIVQRVIDLGNLWANRFFYEDYNGDLCNLWNTTYRYTDCYSHNYSTKNS